MNNIYKVVFNQSLGAWVAVSELARGHVKSISTAKLLSAAFLVLGLSQSVASQPTTIDFTNIVYKPTVEGEPTNPNGPWGKNAGDGAAVAGAGQSIRVTGTLKSIGDNINRGAFFNDKEMSPALLLRRPEHRDKLLDWIETDEDKLAAAREKHSDLITKDEFAEYIARSDGTHGPKASNYRYDISKRTVQGVDPITGLSKSFQVFDNDRMIVQENMGPSGSFNVRYFDEDARRNFYTESRLVTAKEGGKAEVKLEGGNHKDKKGNHYLNMAIKHSHLFVADGKDSELSFSFDDGKNTPTSKTLYVQASDTYLNSVQLENPQDPNPQVKGDTGQTKLERFFEYNHLAGTFTPTLNGSALGDARTVSNLDELKAYNEFLISKIQDKTIKSQEEYDALFEQAIKRQTITILLDENKLPSAPDKEYLRTMGARSYFHASNGGKVQVEKGTVIVSDRMNTANQDGLADPTENTFVAAFSADGEGSEAINKGELFFRRGTIYESQGMVSKNKGTVINEGAIYGGLIPENLSDDKLQPFVNAGSLMRALDGGVIINKGTLNIAHTNQRGLHADEGGQAINDEGAHIHVGFIDIPDAQNTPPKTKPSIGMYVHGAGKHSNKGSIHIGSNDQGNSPINPRIDVIGVVVHEDGSANEDPSFTNTGTIKIYEKMGGATGILLDGSNNIVENKGDIEILGKGGDRNIGISFAGNIGNKVTNTANIIVKGKNNIGVHSFATNKHSYENLFLNTDKSSIQVHAAEEGGSPNYGVWAEGGTVQIDGKVDLQGSNSIAIHARNKGNVVLGATASVTTDKNATNQTSFFIHGAEANIKNNSTRSLVAEGKSSTLFRIDGKASYDGSGGNASGSATLEAKGDKSVALLATAEGSSVKTGSEIIIASGADSTALKVAGGASGELTKDTTLKLTGARARAAVVDGELITIDGISQGIQEGTKLTSFASITSELGAKDSRAYEVTNEGILDHQGKVNLQGSDEIAVLLTKGGKFVNQGSIVVAGNVSDGGKTRAAVDVSGASTNDKSSVFEHLSGNVQLTNGQYGDAAIRIGDGASLDMSGKNVSEDATIKAGGEASVILVDTGAKSLTLGANTLSLLEGGTGAIVENKAEIEGITIKDTVFEVTDGVAIRTGSKLAKESSGTINITGAGTGIVFANRDSTDRTKFTTTDKDLHVGGIDINIKDSAQEGATALYIDTKGKFSSDANIALKSTKDVTAWKIVNAGSNLENGGNLSSVSKDAIIDLSSWIDNASEDGTKHNFTNTGTITSPEDGVAIRYNGSAEKTINLTNQKAANAQDDKGQGVIAGLIDFGKATVNLINANGGVIKSLVTTADQADNITITGKGSDLKGGMNLGAGDNTILIEDGAVQTGHITTSEGKDTLTLTKAKVTAKVDLGAGDDTVEINNSGVDYTDAFTYLDGGEGKDTLTLNASKLSIQPTDSKAGGIHNVEAINLKESTLEINRHSIVHNESPNKVTIDLDKESRLELNGTDSKDALRFGHNLKSAKEAVFKITGNNNAFRFANAKDANYENHKGTTELHNVNATIDDAFANAVKAGTLQLSDGSAATVADADGSKEIGHLTMDGGKLVIDKTVIPSKPENATALVVKNLNITNNKGSVELTDTKEFLNDFDTKGHLANTTQLGLLAQDNGKFVVNVVEATGDVNGAGLTLKLGNEEINKETTHTLAIKQDGEKVADATYGLQGMVSADMPNKGINVVYGLTTLKLAEGKQLELRPAGDTQDDATLTAQLTGEGGLLINKAGDLAEVSISNADNKFTGQTTVKGGTLKLLSSNALGQKDSHTEKVALENGSALALVGEEAKPISAYAGALSTTDESKVTLTAANLNLSHRKEKASTIAKANTLSGDKHSTITLLGTDKDSSLTIHGAQDRFAGKAIAETNTSFILKDKAALGSAQIELKKDGKAVFDAVSGNVANQLYGEGTLVANKSDISLTADNSKFKGKIDIKDDAKVLVEAVKSLGQALIATNDKGTLSLSKMKGDDGKLTNEITGKGTVATVNDAQISLTKENNDFAGTWDINDNTQIKATDLGQLGSAAIATNDKGTLNLSAINASFGSNTVTGKGTISLSDKTSLTLNKDSSADKFGGTFDIQEGTTLKANRSSATAATELAHQIKGKGTYAVNANGQGIHYKAEDYSAFKGTLALSDAVLTLTDENLKATHSDTTLVLNGGAKLKGAQLDAQKEIGSLHFNGGQMDIENSVIGRESPNEAALLVKDLEVKAASGVSVLADDFNNDLPLPDQMISLLRQDDEPAKAIHLIKATGEVVGDEADLTVKFVDAEGNDRTPQPTVVAITQDNEKVADASYGLSSKLIDATKTNDTQYKDKGLYAQYLLQSLNLVKGKQLQLIADEGNQSSDATTLSAQLTGEGGVSVNTPGSKDEITISNESNDFTGQTTVEGGTLIAGSANALGSADSHSNLLELKADASFKLADNLTTKDTVYVGCVKADEKSGGIHLSSGHLAIHGCAEDMGDSVIAEGKLQGDEDAMLELATPKDGNKNKLVSTGAQNDLKAKITIQSDAILQIDDEKGAGSGAVTIADKGELIINANGNVANQLDGDGQITVNNEKSVELSGNNGGLSEKAKINLGDDATLLVKTPKDNLGKANVDTQNSGNVILENPNGTIDATIAGKGNVDFSGLFELMPKTLESFTGKLKGKDNSTLIAGKQNEPIHLKLSTLEIDETSTVAAVGSLKGNVINQGTFIVGDLQKGDGKGPGSKSNYTVGGDFTNKATGRIVLGSPSDLDSNVGSVLTVNNNYHGEAGSTLHVNTIWNNPNYSETDRLVIKGTATGRTEIVIADGVMRGDVSAFEDDKYTINVVEVAKAHEGNVFTGSAETQGAEQIQLVKVGNNYQWKLNGTFSQSVPGYAQAPVANTNLGFSTIGTLHERLGAKSQYTKDGIRLWGQMKLGELDLTGADRLYSESDYRAWILGADIATQVNPDTKSHNMTGLMLSYTDAEMDTFDKERKVDGIISVDKLAGNVDTARYGLGAYHTRYHRSGAYLDLVTEVSKIKNKYSSRNGIRAKQDGWSAIVSAEVGHQFSLANDFFVEPQAQLMYQHLSLDSFSDKARKVDPDTINAVRGRVGVRAGKNFVQPDSVHTNSLYGLVNVVRDFTSSPSVQVGKDKVAENFNRTFVEVGIGGQAALGKSLSLYADGRLERNLDGKERSGFRAKVGLKYSW